LHHYVEQRPGQRQFPCQEQPKRNRRVYVTPYTTNTQTSNVVYLPQFKNEDIFSAVEKKKGT